ncbi:MAG: hypothetical protein ABI114_02195 [Rhodanobacter sp.]
MLACNGDSQVAVPPYRQAVASPMGESLLDGRAGRLLMAVEDAMRWFCALPQWCELFDVCEIDFVH